MAEERTAKDGEKASKSGAKPDYATIAGILVAAAGIVGGLLLEGGRFRDILQVTAAMIVLGGTIGAVMVSTPTRVLTGSRPDRWHRV